MRIYCNYKCDIHLTHFYFLLRGLNDYAHGTFINPSAVKTQQLKN